MERETTTPDGTRLWAQTFGRPDRPAILLVMGGTAQGIVWPDALCERLAANGYFVVRYDHRDTGLSAEAAVVTRFAEGTASADYDLTLLADDAAVILEGLGLTAAHVVGQSVGGMVAQLLALRHPGLVRSLVLLSSSPDANADVHTLPSTGLPGPCAPTLDRVARLTAFPPSSAEERFAAAVDGWRVLLGPTVPFDRVYWEDLVRRVMARSTEPDTAGRHLGALDRTPPLTGLIRSLTVPTLVVHGEQDPVFPLEHARELHRVLPRSRLRQVAGMGHIFPPHWSPWIAAMIVDHVRRSGVDRSERRNP